MESVYFIIWRKGHRICVQTGCGQKTALRETVGGTMTVGDLISNASYPVLSSMIVFDAVLDFITVFSPTIDSVIIAPPWNIAKILK